MFLRRFAARFPMLANNMRVKICGGGAITGILVWLSVNAVSNCPLGVCAIGTIGYFFGQFRRHFVIMVGSLVNECRTLRENGVWLLDDPHVQNANGDFGPQAIESALMIQLVGAAERLQEQSSAPPEL